MNLARRTCLGIAVSLTALIWLLGLIPVGNLPSVPGGDKLHHGLAYTALMLAWGLWVLSVRGVFVCGALLALMGVVIEFAQEATGYRSFEVADMVANASGVLLGLLLLAVPMVRRLRRWVHLTAPGNREA